MSELNCKAIEAIVNEYNVRAQVCEMHINHADSYEGARIEEKLARLKGIKIAAFVAADVAGVEVEWCSEGHLLGRLRIK